MSAPRTVMGISFDVHSPSIWQVAWPPLYVVYNGNGWIIMNMSDEPMHVRLFPNLIEAIDIISRSVEK